MSRRFNFFLSIVLPVLFCITIAQSASAQKGKVACSRQAAYGNTTICLPFVAGMKECYEHPVAKALADKYEYEGNSVLGYYLNDSTYRFVDSLDQITYSDYFKIYVTNQLKDVASTTKDMDEVAKVVSENYLQKDWKEIQDKVDQQFKDLTIGKPVTLDTYSPDKNVRSFILLVKYQAGEKEALVLMSLDMLLIKERLVWMAYYQNYDGAGSVTHCKAKNDRLVNLVLQGNQ